MRFRGARVAIDGANAVKKDLCVRDGRVIFSDSTLPDEAVHDLSGFLILPGLINAHDHLELNLFPHLGSGTYKNAKTWAEEIHRPAESPVKEHCALSKPVRLLWGALKNLLCGVTTVAHHNPYDSSFDDAAFPLHVVKECGWAHSLDFSPDLLTRYENTPSQWPFIIHAAEGTDAHARSEISHLERLGVLSDRTVLVHAIGLDQPDLHLLKARRSSLVWCPSSNISLFGETMQSAALNSGIPIALGTDSAMTAAGDLFDEIANARRIGRRQSAEIYEMVTSRAARMLCLKDGQGAIHHGGVADLIVIEEGAESPAEAFEQLQIEMVMVAGRVQLASERVLDRIGPIPRLNHSIELEGRGQWFTRVDVPALYRQTAAVLGPDFRLAGKRVAYRGALE